MIELNTLHKLPNAWETNAIGIAKVTAVSIPLPVDKANAVAKTPPTIVSGGI